MQEDNIPEHFLQKIQYAKERKHEKLDLSNYYSTNIQDKLTKIPEQVFELKHLKILILNNNRIYEIPKYIENLANLTHLYLSENQLSTIPESVENMANLTWLDLGGNQLSSIPEFMVNMANLTWLSLARNQLSSIPEFMGNMANLTWLSLAGNQLSSIPESMGNLSNLTGLSLTENPLVNPPIEIADKGIEAIREYFKHLQEVGTDRIYEAKLLIVGEAGSGKTSLAKKIENSAYKLKPSETSTEGIDIIKKSFSLENGEEFQINIWDFGGQEIYHATHRFFLTKRSLYCLVLDNREEDDNLYYWLNIVELLSDNSPLLIIKNEKQNRTRDINERILKGQFDNIKETLSTNLATNKNLDKIFTSIKYFISNLNHIGGELPATWVKVRRSIEKDERNYIDLNEFLKICDENGINRKEDKLLLSGYLHDIGVCLHFQDDQKSILYKTVILKPEWGTEAVYRVLDNPTVKEKYGCFNDDDLQDIWHEAQYDDMRGELLQLMMKFELCYQILGRQDTYISPQLLSNNQPEYDWDESDNLILRYTYPNFMPKGIISRFIVVMHQDIDQQKYLWKTGVILKRNHTKAEVIEDFDKREIKIRVTGKDMRGLMTIVSHELDKINDSYRRLKYQKLIPCNCEKCQQSKNYFFYDFKILKNFIYDRQREIQCQQSYKMVDTLSLIDDVFIGNKSNRQEEDNEHLPHQYQSLFSVNIENLRQQQGRNNTMSDIRQSHSGNGDNVGGNQNTTHDQSGSINISDNATVNASGAGTFNLGKISGTVANIINHLPNFEHEPDKKELKELLRQLHNAVLEAELDDDDQEESLELVQAIASSITNSQDGTVKKTAKRAMKILRGTAAALPPGAAMVTICNQLPDLISKIF